MDSTYLSLFCFIVLTIGYYFFKGKLLAAPEGDTTGQLYQTYLKTTYSRVAIYFLAVVLVQFAINAGIIINKCGGSVTQNIGSAFIMTFVPWVLIFGVLIAVLIIFPGFKSAFSNVVGYFVVASSANNLLTQLLIDVDIDKAIQTDNSSEENKKGLQKAADAILKLCGNMSILINQIVPSNFDEYWEMLKPLMKPEYQTGDPVMKQKLLDLVVRRDNIGEAMWFLYTAILLTSIIQYNLSSKGCVKDLAAMQKSQQEFVAQQAAEKEKQEKAKSVVYKVDT